MTLKNQEINKFCKNFLINGNGNGNGNGKQMQTKLDSKF